MLFWLCSLCGCGGLRHTTRLALNHIAFWGCNRLLRLFRCGMRDFIHTPYTWLYVETVWVWMWRHVGAAFAATNQYHYGGAFLTALLRKNTTTKTNKTTTTANTTTATSIPPNPTKTSLSVLGCRGVTVGF